MIKYCSNCGRELGLHQMKCHHCGMNLNPKSEKVDVDDVVTTGGFFWSTVLFALGIIGFVAAIIFSVKHSNENMKHYARAWIIFHIIAFVVIAIYLILFGTIFLAYLEEVMAGLK